MAAEPNFEFRFTVSHWMKHGDRVGTPVLCQGCSEDFRAELYWRHHKTQGGDSSQCVASWFQVPPHPTLSGSCLTLAASSQGVWELALPPPAPLRRSTVTPIQRSDLGCFGALLPADHLAQGQGHIPPLLSSASQRCELPINSFIPPHPPTFPEKTNIVV